MSENLAVSKLPTAFPRLSPGSPTALPGSPCRALRGSKGAVVTLRCLGDVARGRSCQNVGSLSMDPFTQLSLPPKFDVDPRQLRAAWLRVAAAAHPDATGTVDSASAANDAYRSLLDPIERAHALLRRLGLGGVLEDDALRRAFPGGFLLEMMEYRERADAFDASDAEGRHELLRDANGQRDAALARIAVSFGLLVEGGGDDRSRQSTAADIARELNVIRSFDRMIEQLERERGGGSP